MSLEEVFPNTCYPFHQRCQRWTRIWNTGCEWATGPYRLEKRKNHFCFLAESYCVYTGAQIRKEHKSERKSYCIIHSPHLNGILMSYTICLALVVMHLLINSNGDGIRCMSVYVFCFGMEFFAHWRQQQGILLIRDSVHHTGGWASGWVQDGWCH